MQVKLVEIFMTNNKEYWVLKKIFRVNKAQKKKANF